MKGQLETYLEKLELDLLVDCVHVITVFIFNLIVGTLALHKALGMIGGGSIQSLGCGLDAFLQSINNRMPRQSLSQSGLTYHARAPLPGQVNWFHFDDVCRSFESAIKRL